MNQPIDNPNLIEPVDNPTPFEPEVEVTGEESRHLFNYVDPLTSNWSLSTGSSLSSSSPQSPIYTLPDQKNTNPFL